MTGTNRRTARVLRTWEKSARSYDRKMASLETGWFSGGREWIGQRATGRVLDVAVGTGRNLPYYPADAIVTGIDISPAMVTIARQRAADLGKDVDLHTGDAEHLPYDDDSFDTAVCALSLCAIPNPVAAISEMRRVLAPGGRLLLIDHIGSDSLPILAGQWLLERFTIPIAGEHHTRRHLPVVESAGLHLVEVERLKKGTIERIHAVKSQR